METFNLKKLNKVHGTEQYRVEITNKFAALEWIDISRTWVIIRDNLKISAKESIDYYELKDAKNY
jgi:hypothetical protein